MGIKFEHHCNMLQLLLCCPKYG